jgi:hypothetical protein
MENKIYNILLLIYIYFLKFNDNFTQIDKMKFEAKFGSLDINL